MKLMGKLDPRVLKGGIAVALVALALVFFHPGLLGGIFGFGLDGGHHETGTALPVDAAMVVKGHTGNDSANNGGSVGGGVLVADDPGRNPAVYIAYGTSIGSYRGQGPVWGSPGNNYGGDQGNGGLDGTNPSQGGGTDSPPTGVAVPEFPVDSGIVLIAALVSCVAVIRLADRKRG